MSWQVLLTGCSGLSRHWLRTLGGIVSTNKKNEVLSRGSQSRVAEQVAGSTVSTSAEHAATEERVLEGSRVHHPRSL